MNLKVFRYVINLNFFIITRIVIVKIVNYFVLKTYKIAMKVSIRDILSLYSLLRKD